MVCINACNVNNLAELQQLFVKSVQEVCSKDYTPAQVAAWLTSIEDKKRWTSLLVNQYALAATLDDRIVGFATLDQGNYIDCFYVHPDYQRQSIGAQLYGAIQTEALRQNQDRLTANVSITARPFFEKMGFVIMEKQRVVRKHIVMTNYKMKKSLSR